MATVVDQMPDGRSRKGSKYDRFLDGRIWLLERGTDWPINTKLVTVAMTLRAAAKKLGKSVRIRTIGDAQLYVQAFTREEKSSGDKQG